MRISIRNRMRNRIISVPWQMSLQWDGYLFEMIWHFNGSCVPPIQWDLGCEICFHTCRQTQWMHFYCTKKKSIHPTVMFISIASTIMKSDLWALRLRHIIIFSTRFKLLLNILRSSSCRAFLCNTMVLSNRLTGLESHSND